MTTLSTLLIGNNQNPSLSILRYVLGDVLTDFFPVSNLGFGLLVLATFRLIHTNHLSKETPKDDPRVSHIPPTFS